MPVALGTDGMPCLDTPDRITTLDDVRLLLGEGAPLQTVLEMATTHGIGERAGNTALEEVAMAIARGEDAPDWVLPPRPQTLESGAG